ncbi:hypothetical protein CYMTET_33922 [Cymbomonas tetramitiformis]|uniref:Anaphase-promoting complex subunit 6 n=1 Tax=Cymbomonas tetramitiformis TaxID=36881 RepID=A0AAE0FCM5_9CHLO|nr:hypothetical protein CYMTET_33922 [Cymbomonas tetramitiformis]
MLWVAGHPESRRSKEHLVNMLAGGGTSRARRSGGTPRQYACGYKAALSADPFCYDALEQLLDNHMLTSDEEKEMLASLKLGGDDQWLLLLYSCKAKKYDQVSDLREQFEQLSCSAPDAPASPPATSGVPQPSDSLTNPNDGNGTVYRLLRDNVDVVACQADWHYHRGEYQCCYDITHMLLERDPYHLSCLPTHLAAALELHRKNELFLRAHQLMEEHPDRAISWFAVGCYYYCIRNFDSARRYFSRATQLSGGFAPAWLGFGNSFAAQDESDQAMAAYRTATRLFPGSHLPVLCIGMEYQRTNNLPLAEQFFLQGREICPSDPLVFNELGVLAYRNKDYAGAEQWLRHALTLVPAPLSEAWEATVVNLAHSLRKQHQFVEAIQWYERALALNPCGASTHAAVAYTYHLQGMLENAISNYHKALGLKPDDSFTHEMLHVALQEQCTVFSSF